MKEMAEEIQKNPGKSYNRDDVKEMIQNVHSKKLKEARVVEILDNKISDGTIRNYISN